MQQSSGGGPWKHDPTRLFRLTWQVWTRVRVIEIQSLVQYWIKTVCCRNKDHFHWTAPCIPCTPLVPKVWDIVPHTPGCAAHGRWDLRHFGWGRGWPLTNTPLSSSHLCYHVEWKKRSGNAAKNIRPAADPLPGGAGRPKFDQLEMVTTNPVWWGSMHAISS